MLESDENGIINDGSSVVIDFKGFKDGVAFAGGEAKDYELIVGSQQFIPGFEEQMVGMKTGETKTIEVTFPQDYHSNDLAGQPVKFDVTVKAVNIVRKPTIDKTYLEKFKNEGVDDEVKFRAYLKQQLFD
jgi:trigger factor